MRFLRLVVYRYWVLIIWKIKRVKLSTQSLRSILLTQKGERQYCYSRIGMKTGVRRRLLEQLASQQVLRFLPRRLTPVWKECNKLNKLGPTIGRCSIVGRAKHCGRDRGRRLLNEVINKQLYRYSMFNRTATMLGQNKICRSQLFL